MLYRILMIFSCFIVSLNSIETANANYDLCNDISRKAALAQRESSTLLMMKDFFGGRFFAYQEENGDITCEVRLWSEDEINYRSVVYGWIEVSAEEYYVEYGVQGYLYYDEEQKVLIDGVGQKHSFVMIPQEEKILTAEITNDNIVHYVWSMELDEYETLIQEDRISLVSEGISLTFALNKST